MTGHWKTLRDRAIDYRESANILAEAEKWANAIENAHLSVELALKTALEKRTARWPAIHDLQQLVKVKVHGTAFFSRELRRTRSVRLDFGLIRSAWNMQYRYQRVAWTALDAMQLLDSYERVYRWIMDHYVD